MGQAEAGAAMGERTSSSTPVPTQRRRRPPLLSGRVGTIAAQLLIVVGVIVAWEGAIASGLLSARTVGQPSAIYERIVELLRNEPTYGNATIYEHILVTLQELIPGFFIGSVAGLAVGFIFARSAITAAVLEPYIMSLYSIPKIALAPVFILFFGIGAESKVAIVVVGTFFMVFFNTYAGVAGVNEEHVNLARIMGASPSKVMRRIILPSAMTGIVTGFKMAIPFAMIGAIVGEFIASFKGLGFFIKQATALFDPNGLMAGIFFLVILTWVIGQIFARIEGRLLRWQPRRAAAEASNA